MAIRRRLVVLSVYPEDQAGTRLRAHQFQAHLADAGVDTEYWSFLSLRDSRRWFGDAGPLARLMVLARGVLRTLWLPGLLGGADVVLVLREALPIASAVVERAAARRAPVVWDVDDAIWTDYPRLFARWMPARMRLSPVKYEQIAGLATEVWAGSEVLAQWCRRHAAEVHVVPTVLDLATVCPSSGRSGAAAWVGSASTAEFLETVLPALAGIDPPLEVRCVGAGDVEPHGVAVSAQPWTQEAEEQVLADARVGLYPIDLDHPLGPGKAGLKAVLYMAHGVPSVVTPTETVAGLVRDGVEGFHAATPEQWRDRVQRLLGDDELWQRMAGAARSRAESHYSLGVWGPWVQRRVIELGSRAA